MLDASMSAQLDLRFLALLAAILILTYIPAKESSASVYVAIASDAFAGEQTIDEDFVPIQEFLKASLADCDVEAVKCTRVGQVLEVAVVAAHFGRVVRGGRAYLLEQEAARKYGKALGIDFVSICSESATAF